MNLYQKLHDIQKSVRGLAKDKKSYNFEYVSGTKVISHVRYKMDELGLLLKQEVTSITNNRQDYATKHGQTSEILSQVMMRFTWIDIDTGETDVNEFGANGQNGFDKGVGSALTYAERYFLLKYFHIPTDEDDIDNPDRKPTDEDDKKQVKQSPVEMGEKQFNQALEKINKGEKDVIKNIQTHNLPISSTQLKVLLSAEKNYKPTT